MSASAALCCSGSFNTGVILPCALLGIFLFLFFTHRAFTCRACFQHRHVNFAKCQDAGQTPNGSTKAKAQKPRAPASADFGSREAPDPSSQVSSVISGICRVDGELSIVQAEEYGYREGAFINQTFNEKQPLDGVDDPGWQLQTEVEGIIAQLEPHPLAVFKQTGSYHMTMGLKKLDLGDWLALDNDYLKFHTVRKDMLDDPTSNDEVIQYIDAYTTNLACSEVLTMVSSYLAKKHPDIFRIYHQGNKKYISNRLTQERHLISTPSDNMDSMDPLEIAARLTMEDLNILKKGDDGRHQLIASATLFPAGWVLKERIGWRITDLHHPVPQWENKLSASVEKYFSRMTSNDAMERSTYFIQIVPTSDEALITKENLFIQDPKDFFRSGWNFCAAMAALQDPNCYVVRHERQTFRRLELSDAILFTVKTSMQRLVDLSDEQCVGLLHEIRSWPDDIASYKGRCLWGRWVIDYLLSRI